MSVTGNNNSNSSSASAVPFFSMGRETYQVPVRDLFVANRERLVASVRRTPTRSKSLVFLRGGSSERYDSDHEPIFRQESYFWYLTGVKEPDVSVMIDVVTGRTTLFVPKLPPDYATIMGRIKQPNEWKEHYCVDEVKYAEDVRPVLEALLHGGENGDRRTHLLLLKGRNSDSGNWYEPPADMLDEFSSPSSSDRTKAAALVDTTTLFPVLAEQRVVKSPAELHLLRHVTEATSFAHAYVMRNVQPRMMEYQGESLFRHYCYFNYGCRLVGYTPICGCGPNAAILHYGHSGEPNRRQMRSGDVALFDMGAEYYGYGSDVTCSFPVNGKFTDKQKLIHTGVLNAQIAVYNAIKPGVSYLDCHKVAEAEILKQLIEIGIVTPRDKSVDELVEMRLGAVFMPHGLGHFIGIDTHDVGGYLDGHPPRSPLPGLNKLRTARVLLENMTLTVEPGCYFIDHLLDEALSPNSPNRIYLNSDTIAEYRGFGGIRLEDVVVVTSTGCINYTLCPRTIEEVESVMAGGKWPPIKDEAPELRRLRLTEPNPLPSPPSK